jgi:hypothetical protein
LSQDAVEGNALLFFFRDTLTVMKLLAKNQTVTTAQAQWASFTYLMTLAGEQALMFLPGKLGLLVSAWQSHSWFQASLDAATAKRWGQALSEFSAGLAMLVSSRLAREEEIQRETEEEVVDTTHPAAPEFSWQNNSLTADVKARLQTYEVDNVELKSLRKDPLLNLYEDPVADKRYAVVGGKVFQIRQYQDHWRIVNGTVGPQIHLNQQQQWQLDLRWGLVGGGPALSRLRKDPAEDYIKDIYITEASGMPDIRLLYRDRARRIGMAHLQAKRYLEDALDNLKFPDDQAGLDARTADIIKPFFGVQTVSPALLRALQSKTKALFDELLHASLSPFSSQRYVVGVNKAGHEQTLGFTVKSDPQKRVFLTERFFRTPSFRLNPAVDGKRFDVGAHFRASILIHELSHLVLDTHDITYVEASSPFGDLLREDSLGLALLKRDIRDMQEVHLSAQTPRDQLFRVFEHGYWRDLTELDGEGKSAILRITKKSTLDAARDVFLSDEQKRWEIMLENADSLTLLLTRLGREAFT